MWRGSTPWASLMAVSVGVRLPVEWSAAIFLDGLLRGGTLGSMAQQDPGLLRAAGWITGGALAGMALAAWAVRACSCAHPVARWGGSGFKRIGRAGLSALAGIPFSLREGGWWH